MSLDKFAPAIFVVLWSTGWIVAKYASLHSGPFTFLMIRYSLSALAFVLLCSVTGARWPRDWSSVFRAVYSGIFLHGIFLHGIYLGGLWWAIAGVCRPAWPESSQPCNH